MKGFSNMNLVQEMNFTLSNLKLLMRVLKMISQNKKNRLGRNLYRVVIFVIFFFSVERTFSQSDSVFSSKIVFAEGVNREKILLCVNQDTIFYGIVSTNRIKSQNRVHLVNLNVGDVMSIYDCNNNILFSVEIKQLTQYYYLVKIFGSKPNQWSFKQSNEKLILSD